MLPCIPFAWNSSWEKVIRKSKSLEKAKGRRGPGVSDVGELIGKNSQIQSEDVIYDIYIYIYWNICIHV